MEKFKEVISVLFNEQSKNAGYPALVVILTLVLSLFLDQNKAAEATQLIVGLVGSVDPAQIASGVALAGVFKHLSDGGNSE